MTPHEIGRVLSQPIRIKHLAVANRLVMGPMAAHVPDKDGGATAQTAAFFEARARGGVGMIIAGGIIATPRSYEEAPFKTALRLDLDKVVPSFRRVADAVHAHGVPIIAEIMPGFGRMGIPGPGRPIISASPINVVIPEDRFPKGIRVPGGRTTPMPMEASVAEIEQYEREMVDAAERAHRANWDGVEVAAHMSYFAASFLSPRTNWRTDQYGGSLENRARLLVNVVTGIRRRISSDFVVGLRITANDYMPDGQGPKGFAALAKQVELAGIDYVALSAGCYETMNMSAPGVDGGLIDSGDAFVFKKMLSVPVLLQGLHDPARAAQAVADGHGDMVMLARPLLADPNYARKVAEGRPNTIIRCNRDNHCIRRLMFNMPVRCTMNSEMGRESRRFKRLPPPKRLVQGAIESLILRATGSARLMSVIGPLMKKFG